MDGDAHCGPNVRHRSRVAVDPEQPNLRQVHLIAIELLDELKAKGFDVLPSQLGENITTSGLDLLALPRGTRLVFGDRAEIEVTGLRNPCQQIERFRPGMLAEVVRKTAFGEIERKAGVMGVVIEKGTVRPGDAITIRLPPEPHEKLERV